VISQREEFDVLEGKKINKSILALPSFGCEHYFSCGGCAMCGFNREIVKYGFRNLHPKAITALVKIFLIDLHYKIKDKKIDTMCVFMAGSFLNDSEFSYEAQNSVLDYFITSRAKKLIIESRPEYVLQNRGKISKWRKKLGEKKFKINLGLEAVNDNIRNKHISKNLKIKDYQEAVQIIKECDILSGTYILAGCPFLSEDEIVKETVRSAKFAWESGSNVVNIEVYCVQTGTKWCKFYKEGHLIVPSLWAVLEIVKQINLISDKWHLGEFSDWPEPIASPDSCSKCKKELIKVLLQLRLNHEINILEKLSDCQCRKYF
jgi:radical SAM enzyme (TIGR01210 family)